ncbi:MAG TPA: sortase [Rubrobacter sp.]|jgi:sortase A|nr:sortase [Rubrobacter sp.]
MRGFFGTGLGRFGIFTCAVIAMLAIGALALAGRGMIAGADAQPAERAIQPSGAEAPTPEPVAETEPENEASASPPATVPAGALMSLSVPAMGISDIPVVEGTSEASLSQGAGHLPGTGYPWVAGSNTYIAGHRIGYPGTASDHVFWNLPNLGQGDRILLTASDGTTYTYAVSEILEVSPTDLSVTAPTGGDVVTLQTCIEDYGDYWTPGPNWYARYIVRGTMV